MLIMGFVDDVECILFEIFEYKQVVLFFVIMLLVICKFSVKYLYDLFEVICKVKIVVVENILQSYIQVVWKMDVFIRVFEVELFEVMIVFVCIKQVIEEIVEKLCV